MDIKELYKLYQQHPCITTDSRNCPEGSIFLALKGESFNGNKFALQALEKGCAYAIVDEDVEELSAQPSTASRRVPTPTRVSWLSMSIRTQHMVEWDTDGTASIWMTSPYPITSATAILPMVSPSTATSSSNTVSPATGSQPATSS